MPATFTCPPYSPSLKLDRLEADVGWEGLVVDFFLLGLVVRGPVVGIRHGRGLGHGKREEGGGRMEILAQMARGGFVTARRLAKTEHADTGDAMHCGLVARPIISRWRVWHGTTGIACTRGDGGRGRRLRGEGRHCYIAGGKRLLMKRSD